MFLSFLHSSKFFFTLYNLSYPCANTYIKLVTKNTFSHTCSQIFIFGQRPAFSVKMLLGRHTHTPGSFPHLMSSSSFAYQHYRTFISFTFTCEEYTHCLTYVDHFPVVAKHSPFLHILKCVYFVLVSSLSLPQTRKSNWLEHILLIILGFFIAVKEWHSICICQDGVWNHIQTSRITFLQDSREIHAISFIDCLTDWMANMAYKPLYNAHSFFWEQNIMVLMDFLTKVLCCCNYWKPSKTIDIVCSLKVSGYFQTVQQYTPAMLLKLKHTPVATKFFLVPSIVQSQYHLIFTFFHP